MRKGFKKFVQQADSMYSSFSEGYNAQGSSQQPYSSPSFRPVPPPPTSQTTRNTTGMSRCIGKDNRLAKYTQFFALKSSPSFTICTPCYQSHVVATGVLTYDFELSSTSDPDEESACTFAYPGPLGIFHNRCIPSRTVQPLVDFVNQCTSFTACDGAIITTAGPYYTAARNAIPGMSVCPTCYECFIHHTVWESHFIRVPDGSFNGTRQWTCDLANPFIQRSITTTLASTSDFTAFADETKARMAAPECPGPGNPITQFLPAIPDTVFSGKDGRGGSVCFSCYCDCLANTSLEREFVPARLTADQKGRTTCDLAHSYSKMAMEVAVRRGDDAVWRDSMKMTATVGVCPGKNGIDEGEMRDMARWYRLSGSPQVEVCANDYWLKVVLYGAGHLFEPVDHRLQPGVVRMCSLSAANSGVPPGTSTASSDNFPDSLAWRGRRLFNGLRIGFECGDWGVLQTVARDMARQPPPCGGNARSFTAASGRRWFGRMNGNIPGDCSIFFCEECYWRAVQGRPYSSVFNRDLTQILYTREGSSGVRCQTYTNRARGMVRTAADTGDLISFARWWNRREELRQKRDAWVPIIQAQRNKQSAADFQRLQQTRLRLNAQRNALSRMGAAGTVDLAGGDQGVRWGNSSVGWGHWTQGSAEAQQDWNAASNIPISVGGGGVQDLSRMYTQAKADEEAFAAME